MVCTSERVAGLLGAHRQSLLSLHLQFCAVTLHAGDRGAVLLPPQGVRGLHGVLPGHGLDQHALLHPWLPADGHLCCYDWEGGCQCPSRFSIEPVYTVGMWDMVYKLCPSSAMSGRRLFRSGPTFPAYSSRIRLSDPDPGLGTPLKLGPSTYQAPLSHQNQDQGWELWMNSSWPQNWKSQNQILLHVLQLYLGSKVTPRLTIVLTPPLASPGTGLGSDRPALSCRWSWGTCVASCLSTLFSCSGFPQVMGLLRAGGGQRTCSPQLPEDSAGAGWGEAHWGMSVGERVGK